MNLTNLTLVSLHLPPDADASQMALAVSLIAKVSARAERYLDRGVQVTARTEIFDVYRAMTSVQLRAWPGTITTVHNDPARQYAASSLIASTDYYLKANGRLQFDFDLIPGPGALKVVHSCGLAADEAAFVAAYPDIADQLAKQVAWEIKRAKTIGEESMTSVAGAGGVQINSEVKFLKETKEVLDFLKRCDM